MAATILIVDDEPDIRELIGEILADEDYRPVLAANAAEARRLREQERPDLILLDVWMPDMDGISLLREWREQNALECPVVMISGHGSVEAAVEATRYGACDFIEKPVSMARLLDTIRKAMTRERPGTAIGDTGVETPDAVEPTGRGAAIDKLRRQVRALAAGHCNVLVRGEPGSGRTLLARWLHHLGPGRSHRLIEIDCDGDDPDHALAEIEQALANGPARVVLDRVERLSPETQRRVLALIHAAGDDFCVLAIAGPSFERMRSAGDFDATLYHHLAGAVLDVPPLRERREDIPDLVRQFADELPAREQLPYRAFPVAAQNRLRQHEWPGNVRELRNLVRQLLLGGSDRPVDPAEVEQCLNRSAESSPEAIETAHSPLFDLPLREAREAFERQYLIARLKQADGSVGQLAEAVEMERTHLYRKLRQLGIDPKQVIEGD